MYNEVHKCLATMNEVEKKQHQQHKTVNDINVLMCTLY